jgi:hypothetical protein
MSQLPTVAPLPLDDNIEPTTYPKAVLETPSPLADVEVKSAPTLITEQEVVFSTAVALSPPLTGWWTRVTRVVAVSTRRVFATPAADARPKPRHHPPRLDFLEDSRMAREMHRL